MRTLTHPWTRDLAPSRWGWLVPPSVWLLVFLAGRFGLLQTLLSVAIGAVVLVAAARRPGTALLALVVVLPFQKYAVAALYHFGFPIGLVRGAGWLKEALAAGIVIAGLQQAAKAGRRLDRLDRLGLLWVGGVTLYFLLPQVLSAPGAPDDVDIRIQGLRANAFFVLLFLGARHVRFPEGFGATFRRWLLGVALAIGIIGLYQYIDPTGWKDFTFDTLEVPRYQEEVLGLTPQQTFQDFGWLSTSPLRVGSVFVSPFEFSDFLLIGLALAAERLVRRRPHPMLIAVVVVLVLGILASHTRIDLLGAVLIGAVVLRPARGRPSAARVRAGLVIVLGLIVLGPLVLGTRFTGAEGGTESSRSHVSEFTTGVSDLVAEPRGQGLGTAPGVGTRFELEETFVSDNAFLQVGNELGVPMMVVFLALIWVLLLTLQDANAAAAADDGLASGLRAAGLALILVGMLHHVWLTFPVAWLFFAGVGLALSRAHEEPVASAGHGQSLAARANP